MTRRAWFTFERAAAPKNDNGAADTFAPGARVYDARELPGLRKGEVVSTSRAASVELVRVCFDGERGACRLLDARNLRGVK